MHKFIASAALPRVGEPYHYQSPLDYYGSGLMTTLSLVGKCHPDVMGVEFTKTAVAVRRLELLRTTGAKQALSFVGGFPASAGSDGRGNPERMV